MTNYSMIASYPPLTALFCCELSNIAAGPEKEGGSHIGVLQMLLVVLLISVHIIPVEARVFNRSSTRM